MIIRFVFYDQNAADATFHPDHLQYYTVFDV